MILAWAALLAAVALLPAVALLAPAAPAQAQTTVWSATLNPVFFSFNDGCDNDITGAECSSTTNLTDSTFTHDSTNYTVTQLYVQNNGSLHFIVDADITTATAALTLVVGSTSLILAEGQTTSSRTKTWQNSGVLLPAGTGVAVSLVPTTTNNVPRVASIVRQVPTSSPTNADSLVWRVFFSEPVSNVDAADFAVSGTTATVTAVAAVSVVMRTYDVTASGGDLASVNGTVALTISSSHNIADGASAALSNTVPTGLNNNSYVLDNTAPSVTISGVPTTSDAPFMATFTFSEAVTGFDVDDITLSNATASSFMTTSTMVYTALVTPTAAGAVTVDVSANAAEDTLTNGNSAATQASSTYTLPDTTAPRVASIVRQVPTSSPTNADSLTWRVTFSEAVSNVNAADFVVSGTTATVTAVAVVSGVTGAYDVTASGGNLAGVSATVTLTIYSYHNIEDAADNELTNTAPTGTNNNSYVVDNTAPSVTISGVPTTSDAPFMATFTFSEAVTGFDVDDITLSNATASSFMTTSTTVYTALVTPTAAGAVTVDVSANAAEDTVGNGNTVATQASSTYTLPVIAPTLVSNAGQGGPASRSDTVDRSQAFTTSAGATLSSAEIISEDTDGDDVAVSLCTVDGSNHPTSDCTDLTAPSSFAAGTLVFTAPANTTLEANTTYTLLITSPGGEAVLLDTTSSDNEDAGGATGLEYRQ